MIYFHRASVTAAGGTSTTLTLKIQGGICQQLLIRANTATTIFDANLVDENDVPVHYEGFSEGEINSTNLGLPMAGPYTLNITNASLNDTFTVVIGVEEG